MPWGTGTRDSSTGAGSTPPPSRGSAYSTGATVIRTPSSRSTSRTFENGGSPRIRFEIDRGGRLRIRELRFEGMTVFSEKRVRKEFLRGAAEHTRADTFVAERARGCFGGTRGVLPEPRVSSHDGGSSRGSSSRPDGRRVIATFDVDEGPVRRSRRTAFQGTPISMRRPSPGTSS